MTPASLRIGERVVGPGRPVYIVAELSANHNHSLEQALALVREAKRCGVDAVKLQTYTADTMTLDCDAEDFVIKGTIWDGRRLHDLYREAYTPWEWHEALRDEAAAVGLDLFSTPFDASAVDFLEKLGMPVHKVASFENGDLPLLERIGATAKPVIMSTGMASLEELDESVACLRASGCSQLALLKCTSAYPAPLDEMNLAAIPLLAARFGCVVGLSDHSMGLEVPLTAVGLGAAVIEKHFTLSRSVPGPDSSFSLEPQELADLVAAVRKAERALGRASFGPTQQEQVTRSFRRSIYVSSPVRAGEPFTAENIRVVRPAHGLHPRYYRSVLGRKAARNLSVGQRLSWDAVSEETAAPTPYAVAGSKPWNREVFDSRITKIPGRWEFISRKEDLTVPALEALSPRFVFFLHWSDKVPADVLDRFECVCFHMTDVPYGRGGSPLQNLIVRGHRTTKLTALRMTSEFDAGPVYMKRDLSLEGSAEEVYRRSSLLAAEMLEDIVRTTPAPVPQTGVATVFKRRKPAESLIPRLADAASLYDFIRMLDADTYPRAFLDHEGFRYRFSRAALDGDALKAEAAIEPLPKERLE